jgi:hypothetical protein
MHGIVGISTGIISTPFGREGSKYGIDECAEIK